MKFLLSDHREDYGYYEKVFLILLFVLNLLETYLYSV